MFIPIHAQSELKIGICKDASSNEFNEFSKLLKKEISTLINARCSVSFKEVNADWTSKTIAQNLQSMMNDNNIDLIITVGFISSNEVSKSSSYSKPIIAANILDGKLQALPLQSDGTTGINNYTYVGSVFNLQKDVDLFIKMFDIKNLTIFMAEPLKNNFGKLSHYLSDNIKNTKISFVSAKDSCSKALSKIPTNTDGVLYCH